jgi:cell division protein FtsI (penicillin-binding protein 3)
VGGKTGSAQIYDRAIHHYTHSYNGSFMGMAPVTNPAIVCVVSLNGTHGEGGFGGVVAAPVFHAVVAEALRVLDTPKDLPDEPPAKTLVAKASDMDDLADADTTSDEPNILEDSDDGTAAPGNSPSPAGPKVPNFRGMSMRAVLAEAAAKGLIVVPAGSGIARLQTPPAGAVLREGERIRVQFSR